MFLLLDESKGLCNDNNIRTNNLDFKRRKKRRRIKINRNKLQRKITIHKHG